MIAEEGHVPGPVFSPNDKIPSDCFSGYPLRPTRLQYQRVVANVIALFIMGSSILYDPPNKVSPHPPEAGTLNSKIWSDWQATSKPLPSHSSSRADASFVECCATPFSRESRKGNVGVILAMEEVQPMQDSEFL